MKYLAIIQARCGSTRLPNKVLLDLAGKPQILRVIERVAQSKYVNEVIVATSIEKQNLPLIKMCCEAGIRIFAGSENDVLDRFYQIAKLIKPEYIIRVTADCPVYDPRMLDLAISQFKPETDYMADINETLPDGLDLEIFKYSALEYTWQNAKLISEREHVTLYIRNNKDKFNIQNFTCPIEGIASMRLTVDEQEDYELINKIYNYFLDFSKEMFYIEDMVDFFKKNPGAEKINDKYKRNEGLIKSLKNDSMLK